MHSCGETGGRKKQHCHALVCSEAVKSSTTTQGLLGIHHHRRTMSLQPWKRAYLAHERRLTCCCNKSSCLLPTPIYTYKSPRDRC